MKASGWGRFPSINSHLYRFSNLEQLRELLGRSESIIARGCGRSYGDSSLNGKGMVSTGQFNRILSFNSSKGILHCQSGVTLSDIVDPFVSQGWFLSVTPGTKFVSVGGAIASDVHGKNHHKDGSFSSCVISFTMMLADGSIKQCSRQKNNQLFTSAFGGMGLTGIILDVVLKLRPISTAYIYQRTTKAYDLDHIMRSFEDASDWTYSVAWIDCLAQGTALGRSVLMVGEHALVEQLGARAKGAPLLVESKQKFSVPFSFPSIALNKFSVKGFNELYFAKAPRKADDIVDYDSFFYPLDGIHHWNRIYGSRGFTQYQCVFPLSNSYEGIKRILETISKRGQGSFLAVLKLFGKQDGLMSFPMEGYTLALDFPINRKLFPLLCELDEITQVLGGRLYLTKDARMDSSFFEASYAGVLDGFKQTKFMLDPYGKFQSLQSIRLGF